MTWLTYHPFLFIILMFATICLVVAAKDYWQKQHVILRNYPLVGHIRYFSEWLGEYIRPYFIMGEREERPFDRAERAWVYRASKKIENVVSFGSTRDYNRVGDVFFVDAPYPTLESDISKTSMVVIGENCPNPYQASSIFNGSAMSFGSLSGKAIEALSHGIQQAGCWMNTGEGGISRYHLAGGADLVAQIGTGKFGYRTEAGEFSETRLSEAAALPQVKMFEIKLSQGAKPGKGGLLPGVKVTPEIAEARKIAAYQDCYSPNRHPEISNNSELLDFVERVRHITGKPVGFKVVLGDYQWLKDLCTLINERGVASAPDFITLDGGEGGTGAAPKALMDYMGLSISETLPILIDILQAYNLRQQIKVIASGKLIRPSAVAWALCCGADFVVSARGFMFALGCIQALRCHTNNCPTGITSHKKRFTRGLDVQSRAQRVASYVKSVNYEVEMISHSCGVKEPRQLNRQHVRLVTEKGTTVSLEKLCRMNSVEI